MSVTTATKQVLSGNEAIACAAWAAGVQVAAAYPGTPSTEILEKLAELGEVYCEWSVNEKVAMEVAIGASFSGARALVAMKHVGLNVALDPLVTFAQIGANGGIVIVSADDPGMHSSQNEQDNRWLAKFARVPMLEPSDSQECFDMIRLAFDISEEFGLPVVVRTTTRISHSSSVVCLTEFKRRERSRRSYEKDPAKTVMVPTYARMQRLAHEDKLCRLNEYTESAPVQRTEQGTDRIGIITSGVAYQYARETFPDATLLKLGMTFPLPRNLIAGFARAVGDILVVEEGDAYLEEHVLAMGIRVRKPETSLRVGELSPDRVKKLRCEIEGVAEGEKMQPIDGLPARPPVMCPGCGHRGVFYALNRLGATVMGDIGCYSLGVFPPLYAMDTLVCMGASIGNAHGMEKARHKERTVAVIGDSTFFHSGITGLLNIVYNKGTSTVIVLDNRTTAMTGHQDHPGTGRTLMGEQTAQVHVEDVARGVGVKRVFTIDPYDLRKTYEVLSEEIDAPEVSVVVSRRPCPLTCGQGLTRQYEVIQAACRACGACLKLGCPAIETGERDSKKPEKHKVRINHVLCVGCGMCFQVCEFGAIRETAV